MVADIMLIVGSLIMLVALEGIIMGIGAGDSRAAWLVVREVRDGLRHLLLAWRRKEP